MASPQAHATELMDTSRRLPQPQPSAQTLTQTLLKVVFAQTQRVGCGYMPGRGTLCNYTPARYGPMWKKGKVCSDCPGGFPTCDRGLCMLDKDGECISSNDHGGISSNLLSSGAAMVEHIAEVKVKEAEARVTNRNSNPSELG